MKTKEEKKEYRRTVSVKYRKENPEKVKARKILFSKLRGNEVKKVPCICGKRKVEAHHPNYSKPLHVVWLCKAHHTLIHHGKTYPHPLYLEQLTV